MKIWTLSDLHTEAGSWAPPSIPDADLCIIAGDIGRGAQEAVEWAAAYVRPHMPVIGVLGNHEFYRHYVERERSAAQHHGWRHDIQMLDDMVWTIGEVRFVGATLWTDFHLDGDPSGSIKAAADVMNDFRLIGTEAGRFSPQKSIQLHLRSVAYIESVLKQPFEGETVVVTHHTPSPRSTHADYKGDALNAAFSSNLDDLIERYQPTAWIHGHTNSSFDYQIEDTRIVCNPKGYGSENKDFDPALVIEIGGYDPRPRYT